VTDLVNDLGFREIIELRWWETSNFDGLRLTHVPARHWGSRIFSTAEEKKKRAYGGYVLRADSDSLYHAGDTAYFEGFREIGRRLHPEIALLPIGAYNPPAFRANHTSPEDAVRAFLELGSRWMVPMHYGTFRLSHEPVDEPLKLLAREAKRLGLQNRVRVLPEGVTSFF
jgi:L-ascorbate metabolism protein UlaG (beta-lactamase superfamily)